MPEARTQQLQRARSRFRMLGIWIPLAAFVICAAVQWALLDRMPDPAATHWAASGAPDGFGPAWTYPVMTLVVGCGVIALIAGTTLLGRARDSAGVDLRFITALNLWFTGFMLAVLMWLFTQQLDLDDASAVLAPWSALIAPLFLGLALGAVGWVLTPKVEPDRSAFTTPDPFDLAPNEQAAWLGTTTMSRWAMAGLVGIIATTFAFAVVIAVMTGLTPAVWILGGTTVGLALLIAAVTVFRVRVDHTGLTVRSALSWPRIHIPIREIRTVEVVEVNPMGEFGGWGWRFSPTHGQGVVLRSGEALRVTRTNGKRFTVTVDDATTAAALLRAHQQRTTSH